MLDANIFSDLVKNPSGRASHEMARATRDRSGQLCTSVIVAAELHYGSEKKDSDNWGRKIEDLLRVVRVVPLGLNVIDHYARVRIQLERAGMIIGANDLLIAAHALAIDSILVTANAREFSRVKGLKYENWLTDTA